MRPAPWFVWKAAAIALLLPSRWGLALAVAFWLVFECGIVVGRWTERSRAGGR